MPKIKDCWHHCGQFLYKLETTCHFVTVTSINDLCYCLCILHNTLTLSIFRIPATTVAAFCHRNSTPTWLQGNIVSKRTKVTVSKFKYLPHTVLLFWWLWEKLYEYTRHLCRAVLVNSKHAQGRSSWEAHFRDWSPAQHRYNFKGRQPYSWLWPGWRNQSQGDYRFWRQHWTLRQRLLWIWSLAMRTLQGREKQILGPPFNAEASVSCFPF